MDGFIHTGAGELVRARDTRVHPLWMVGAAQVPREYVCVLLARCGVVVALGQVAPSTLRPAGPVRRGWRGAGGGRARTGAAPRLSPGNA